MQQPEAKFKKSLVEAFETWVDGGWTIPLAGGSPFQPPGLPDRLFVGRGSHAFVEAKVEGNPLRATQALVLPRMAAGGLRMFVATAWDMTHTPDERRMTLQAIRPDHSLGVLREMPYAAMKTQKFWDDLLMGALL